VVQDERYPQQLQAEVEVEVHDEHEEMGRLLDELDESQPQLQTVQVVNELHEQSQSLQHETRSFEEVRELEVPTLQ
jgi:hypothetical protein